jgi:hypothetical protein
MSIFKKWIRNLIPGQISENKQIAATAVVEQAAVAASEAAASANASAAIPVLKSNEDAAAQIAADRAKEQQRQAQEDERLAALARVRDRGRRRGMTGFISDIPMPGLLG